MGVNDPVLGIELGNEFDQGVTETDLITLKLGNGLTKEPDGSIAVAPPDPVNPAYYIAAGRVTSAGVALRIAGAAVSRTSVGIYQVTLTTPQPDANYGVLLTPEGLAARDDYFMDYFTVTANGFEVRGTEQDNGGTAGVFRDMGFTFYVPII